MTAMAGSDIYLPGAQSVEMAHQGKMGHSALYHNNHDGTFTDVRTKQELRLRVGRRALQSATTTTTVGPICS